MFAKLRKIISDSLDDSRFVIQIEDRRVRVIKGTVPPAFLADLRDHVEKSGLVAGVPRGEREATYMRLVISSDIPPESHQRLRNIWHFHEPTFQTVGP